MNSYNEGLQLIWKRDYEAAINSLKPISDNDEDGQIHALLGLAYFQCEDYEAAAQYYETALSRTSNHEEWQDMFERAKGNKVSKINIPVPDFQYFQRDELIAPPRVPNGTLPRYPLVSEQQTMLKETFLILGNVFGVITTFAMDFFTGFVGKIYGYQSKVWTNWYRRPLYLSILTLAYMRNQLNKNNLRNTYPKGTLIGFQKEYQIPPKGVLYFRTADGSWNNLANPKEGAAGTRFMRNVCNKSIHIQTDDRIMTPNPREISRKLLTREGPMKEIPFLNLLAASWIQFQNHGWISHGEIIYDKPYEIPLANDDPARTKYRQDKMFVGRTQPDPTRMEDKEETPITFINEVTHWWDGSQIYGSDQETVNRLRSGVDGKLSLQQDGTLPLTKKGVEDTGFVRNWWLGLTMLHTLFVKEHNALCDHLKIYYPQWNDNRLFNVSRLINAAVMAKIHTVEWTPAILPNLGLDQALNANWYGILTNLFKVGKHRKTLAEINIRNPEMGGVVGNPIQKHGQPFGLTEEFVEVYRLHSLLPETLKLIKIGCDEKGDSIPIPETRQGGSRKITKHYSMENLFYSFGNQHPGQLILNNYPRFLQEMSIPGNPIFDLGAVDILRARERGVPRYNEFRRQLGLRPIRSYEDLNTDQKQIDKLKKIYGDTPEAIEKLDLMIGTLAEDLKYRPDNFGFGETLFQIFILNATRRLQADRFYTDNYNEQTYTLEGLQWIDNTDFKVVLLRHYPALARTGLANIKNAFEPWDTSVTLCSKRHPLRAYDKNLSNDPWLGDKHRNPMETNT